MKENILKVKLSQDYETSWVDCFLYMKMYCRSIRKNAYILGCATFSSEDEITLAWRSSSTLLPHCVQTHAFWKCWFEVEYILGLWTKPKLIHPYRAWSYDPSLIGTLHLTTELVRQIQVIHQSKKWAHYWIQNISSTWPEVVMNMKKDKYSLCPTGAYNWFGEINYRYTATET